MAISQPKFGIATASGTIKGILWRDRMLALIGVLDEEVAILRGYMTVPAEATHSGITVTTGT